MADKKITEATNVFPTGLDKIPIGRTTSTAAYNVSVGDLRHGVIDVHDYGAVGDGTTDDSTAINLAIITGAVLHTEVGQTRAGRIVIRFHPTKKYAIESPVCMWDMQGVMLDGGAPNFGATLIGKCVDQAMIEIVGSSNIVVQNLQLWGDTTDTPAVGTWTARSNTTHGVNSNNITFRNVEYYGYFTKACHYCVSSESNHLYECWTYPYGDATMEGIVYISTENDFGITPAGGTLDSHGYGNNDMQIVGSGLTGWGVTAIKIMAGCGVTARDTYLYSDGVDAAVEMVGGCYFIADAIGCEGAPLSTIKITYDAAGSNINWLILDDSSMGSPTQYTIYAEDGSILRDSKISSTGPGVSGGACMPVHLHIAQNCDFTGLSEYRSGVFDIEYSGATGSSVQNIYRLGLNDTITLNGAGQLGDIIEDMVDSLNSKLQVPALTIGSGSSIIGFHTATATWDVGSLANGESAETLVNITGVTNDGAWVCFASLTSFTAAAWVITAYPSLGRVKVILTNHTGGTVDLDSGTLRVVAMKIA